MDILTFSPIILNLLWFFIFWIVAFPLFFGIPVFYLTSRQNGSHQIIPCTDKDIPDSSKIFFSEQDSKLTSLGFIHRGYFKHEQVKPNSQALVYTSLYYQPEEHIKAVIILHVIKQIQLSYVEYASQLADDSYLITYNAKNRSAFLYPPHIVIRPVSIRSADELFKNHLAATDERMAGGSKFKNLNQMEYTNESNRINREILDYQVSQGLMKTLDSGRTYQPTLKGAVIMVFKEWVSFSFLKRLIGRV